MIDTNTLKMPKFSQSQQICFLGGVGQIIDCRAESGVWLYMVKMNLDRELNIQRLGSETTVLLYEAEISSGSKHSIDPENL
ncbi:MAG: hypothetical protein KME17_20265 [Cyanosarcina radialis HA8281-LM2]|jgi:hypothetical protein|nr:hypothetical protein [Cyanosarcina radialis HA8281-LM2]